MKLTTLSVPTARLAELGMFPARFFRHNASLEVLQAFRLGGDDLTLLVRIQRKGRGPTEREVERQGAELRERYGLRHFELLSSDPQAREYTVLLRVSMTEGMGEMAHRLGADLLPAQPFVVREADTLISFYATDAQVARVRELLSLLGLEYRVVRARRVAKEVQGPLGALTERQRHLLQLAQRLGYFETPARTDLAHIAAIAGVSKAAVSKQLRSAERKILTSLIGEAP